MNRLSTSKPVPSSFPYHPHRFRDGPVKRLGGDRDGFGVCVGVVELDGVTPFLPEHRDPPPAAPLVLQRHEMFFQRAQSGYDCTRNGYTYGAAFPLNVFPTISTVSYTLFTRRDHP